MAGIRYLTKQDNITINYIVNQLLIPDVHQALFDDRVGWQELMIMMYDPTTIIYGIYHEGKPEPIGVVFFLGVIPYRDCSLNAVIFDKKNRRQGKLRDVIDKIRKDITHRFHIHSCSANTIGKNEASEYILKALGFEKIGEKKEGIVVGGKHRTLMLYYLLIKQEV